MRPTHFFACGNGHVIAAWPDDDGEATSYDLAGCLCPLCLGGVVGADDMIDSRILAPKQVSFTTV